ncbi:MAG: hypothetical protein D6675_07670, partial [Gemmatimonadetes bacterium]
MSNELNDREFKSAVLEGLAVLKASFVQLDERMNYLQGDVSILKRDMVEVKQDIAVLKEDVAVLKK